MKGLVRRLAVLLVAAGFAAACGSENSENGPAEGAAVVGAESAEVRVAGGAGADRARPDAAGAAGTAARAAGGAGETAAGADTRADGNGDASARSDAAGARATERPASSGARGGATRGMREEPAGEGTTAVSDDADEPADSVLRLAAQAYADVASMQAEFTQRATNPLLGRTTTSEGTLFQRRPDRFLMRFTDPEGDRIVSDGTYIWVYYPSVDQDQVMRMSAGAGGAGAADLQAQFLGDPTRRFDATLVGQEAVGGRPAHVLMLRPRTDTGFESLKVWIDARDHLVRRFEITEHNDVSRRFELSGLRTGVSLPDELFHFSPPEGAHVVSR